MAPASKANPAVGGNKSRKRSPPRPGDDDYKTPTQLRNARKRRKLKTEKKQIPSAGKTSKSYLQEDPSLRYLSAPLKAPVVQRAIQFFKEHPAERSGTFDVVVGTTSGWRTVAKLAVRKSSGCLRIGLFAPGTHDLLEIPQCEAHHPRINDAVKVLQKQCRKLDIPPYDDNTGLGNLMYIIVHIGRATGSQQITLVWKENEHDVLDPPALLDKLCQVLISMSEEKSQNLLDLHSLWVHFNNTSKYDNNIVDRSGRWEQRYGQSNAVVEHLPCAGDWVSVPLQFPPQVFRQANIDAFSHIISKIRSWVEGRGNSVPMRNCLELYGGVGTIGLHLCDLISENFVSSDENPFNEKCFKTAVEQLTVKKPRQRCKSIRYEPKNATDMVQKQRQDLQTANLMVVDPPRKGLDFEVLEAFSDAKRCPNLTSLVYVSCGFDAFSRDFKSLTENGDWRLDHAEGHILFPGSDAIETLAFFTRES